MSSYNTFSIELPVDDGSVVECRFQADAGLLDYTTIRRGERLLPGDLDDLRGPVGPSLEALRGERPFWVYGIGTCGDDGRERFARLHFRDGRFADAELIPEPDNLYDWGWED